MHNCELIYEEGKWYVSADCEMHCFHSIETALAKAKESCKAFAPLSVNWSYHPKTVCGILKHRALCRIHGAALWVLNRVEGDLNE